MVGRHARRDGRAAGAHRARAGGRAGHRPVRADARRRRCSTRRARCCARPSCGTTCGRRRNARALEAAGPGPARGSRATSPCRASPRPSCSGCATTSPTCSPAPHTVLLPKAYVRYRLTGELVEDMSDASGTLWLDVGRARLVGRGAGGHGADARAHAAPGGGQRARRARCARTRPRAGAWRPPVLAGGAGDNAAGAVGVSAIRPGDAFVSLGTSGVLFAARRSRFRPYPARRGASPSATPFPALWHQMGVTLSAASSLAWWAGVTGLDRGGPAGGAANPAQRQARRCSRPTSGASARRTMTARCGARSLACRTTRAARR